MEVQDNSVSPVLVSNKVFDQPQEPTNPIVETTGVIIYANKFAEVGEVPMPDWVRQALNLDFGEVGNNLTIQLQQKVQQFPDGPWYVDSIDGVLYIHNKKLQEPSRYNYNYQFENGEVVNVSFETQYITHSIRGSASLGVGMDKDLGEDDYIDLDIDPTNTRVADDYLNDLAAGNWDENKIIEDYRSGRLSEDQLNVLDQRVKAIENSDGSKAYSSALTNKAWESVHKINKDRKEATRKSIQQETDSIYNYYKSQNGTGQYNNAIDDAVRETLLTKDITANVEEFLLGVYGSTSDVSQIQSEIDKAAKGGYLDDFLKRRFSDITYTFKPRPKHGEGYEGAEVNAYGEFYVQTKSIDEVDKNPLLIRTGSGLTTDERGRTVVKVFGKRAIDAAVSGYHLLSAYYTRKYGPGLDIDMINRVIAAANRTRMVTERKLVAKLTVIGNPSLATSQVVTITGVGKKWSGKWYIKSCTHNMESQSGYTTQMELSRHKGVSGFSSVSTRGGHTVNEDTNLGADIRPVEVDNRIPINSINLTSEEARYYNTASASDKNDLIVLKMAGVQDAVVASGDVNNYNNKLSFKLRQRPTKEQRQKYGRAAAQHVQSKQYTKKPRLKSSTPPKSN